LHLDVRLPAVTPSGAMTSIVFKRITAKIAGIRWQRNFFDHRLRRDESEREQFDYVCLNRVRAGFSDRRMNGPTFSLVTS
jgi:hypothetical protein